MDSLAHHAAFCVPTLPFAKSPCIAPKSWTCSASRSDESVSVPRRAVLLAVASFAAQAVLPSVATAQPTQEAETPAPAKGFLTQSGLKYYDFQEGQGPTPKWGDFVLIKYTAYTVTTSGGALVKRDKSDNYSKVGYLIHHGNGEQILGLEEAIHSMSTGGRRRAIIPRPIAYSNSNLGPVPASDRKRRQFSQALQEGDGTVVYDIELVKMWKDPDDRGYYSDETPTDEEVLQMLNEDDSEKKN